MARIRLTLYRKRATLDDILEEINRLLFAKGNRPYPLRPAEIAQSIGVSRHTVYNYIKKLSKRGDVVRLPLGPFFFPKTDKFREFNKHPEIISDPLISEWMDDLLTRKQGLPIKTWRNRLRCLKIVCNTCKVSPYDLTISANRTWL